MSITKKSRYISALRLLFLSLMWLAFILTIILFAPTIYAQGNPNPNLIFKIDFSDSFPTRGTRLDMTITVTNPSNIPSKEQDILLFLTEGLNLIDDNSAHDFYTPLLTQTIPALSPEESVQFGHTLRVSEITQEKETALIELKSELDNVPGALVTYASVTPVSLGPVITEDISAEYDSSQIVIAGEYNELIEEEAIVEPILLPSSLYIEDLEGEIYYDGNISVDIPIPPAPALTGAFIFEPAVPTNYAAPDYNSDTDSLRLVDESSATLKTPLYNMPSWPQVECDEPDAPLSRIGDEVFRVVPPDTGEFSQYTKCNVFNPGWILDVPRTEAEDFYRMAGQLITQTQYVFSMSTLWFNTHNELNETNLVRIYLAPAVAALNESIEPDEPRPLLRFAYSESDWDDPENGFPVDELGDIYEDLTYLLPNDENEWNVRIAVAGIGKIRSPGWVVLDLFGSAISAGSVLETFGVDNKPYSPWNHSKIAVRDYRQAIVGGMNWGKEYITYVDANYSNYQDIPDENRLHDLSIQVEGEAAKAAGIYFDKLWGRSINESAGHRYLYCKTSWEWPEHNVYTDDCHLDTLDFNPTGEISSYLTNTAHHVFALGRGHKKWYEVGDRIDSSADEAIIKALESATKTIYINQHQMTGAVPAFMQTPEFLEFLIGESPELQFYFVKEIKDALINATERGVTVKIVMSEPWGSKAPYSPCAVYKTLYTEIPENAHSRLQFRSFRLEVVDKNNSVSVLKHTHNKFMMIDEQAFYVGSQNLYPSAIGDHIFFPELNEFGFLVDDKDLANEIRNNYWNPIWQQSLDLSDRSNCPGR